MREATIPRIGLLAMACQRFERLGDGTARGTYRARAERSAVEVVRSLELGARVVFPGLILEPQGLAKAREVFRSERVACIVAVFLSWTEDDRWIRFLRDIGDVPLLLYLPVLDRVAFERCEAEDDFVQFLSSCGLVGTLIGSASVKRLGRQVATVVGDLASGSERIIRFARVAAAKAAIFRSRFGLLGKYNEVMWGTYVDPYSIFTIGPELTFLSYEQLRREAESLPEQTVAEEVGRLRSLYECTPGIPESKFSASVAASLAMGNLLRSREIDALAVNDVDHELFESLGLRPGFYPRMDPERLSVIVPEGDLGLLYVSYYLKLVTGGRVNTIEPFYIERETGCFAAGHAGPNDYNGVASMRQVRIAPDARFARSAYRHAGAPFAWFRFPPGATTLAHFSACGSGYKIVCLRAESLPGEHFINGYSHSVFRPERKVEALFEEVISVGTTQHFAVVEGDHVADLAEFAAMSGFDFHAL